jgi:signal peptidase II
VTLRTFSLGSASTLWLSAIIVAADQATKAIVRATLPLYSSANIVPGFVDLTQVRNTGAAFGFLNTAEFPHKALVMMLAAGVALLGIALYAASLPAGQRITRFGLALILGGAVGNLIDRMAFNVADSAITAGVGLMIVDVLGAGRDAPKTL